MINPFGQQAKAMTGLKIGERTIRDAVNSKRIGNILCLFSGYYFLIILFDVLFAVISHQKHTPHPQSQSGIRKFVD